MDFAGHFEHNLDAKGRLTIPAKVREVLLREQPEVPGFWTTIGLDGPLFMYTPAGWDLITGYFPENPFQSEESTYTERWFYYNADFLELDRANRILIPDYLRALAHIQDRVLLVGIKKRVEIWTPERWQELAARIGPNYDRYARQIHGRAGPVPPGG